MQSPDCWSILYYAYGVRLEERKRCMHVTEKLIRLLTEAKYLNADNADRYWSIMRIFYENYEKLRYWMYQEEAYAEMTAGMSGPVL